MIKTYNKNDTVVGISTKKQKDSKAYSSKVRTVGTVIGRVFHVKFTKIQVKMKSLRWISLYTWE